MERFAPKGMVWVCCACGKISPYDKHGDEKSDKGWDASCVLNSALVTENSIKVERMNKNAKLPQK